VPKRAGLREAAGVDSEAMKAMTAMKAMKAMKTTWNGS